MLDEAAEGFGVTGQSVLGCWGDEHAGTERAFVVLAGDGVHLAGALQIDIFALALIGIESVEAALSDESNEADELSKGTDFLFGGVPEAILLLGLGDREAIRPLRFQTGGVKGVVGIVLLRLKMGSFLLFR